MRSLLLVVALAAPAYADNALSPERVPNKARALADKGRAAHQAGDYDAAIAAFKEAYVLAPSPGLLFNIAQAYRLAGNCDEASWMYRRFLDTGPIGLGRKLAEQHLAAVEKCSTGALRVEPPPPEKDDAKLPEPKLGTHAHVTVSSEHDSKLKPWGLVVGLSGAASLATAAAFAIDAKLASDTVADTYKRGGKWSDIADVDARGKRSATIATVTGIAGGVAAATGVALYALGHHYEEAQHVAVIPTTRGAQVSLTWGF